MVRQQVKRIRSTRQQVKRIFEPRTYFCNFEKKRPNDHTASLRCDLRWDKPHAPERWRGKDGPSEAGVDLLGLTLGNVGRFLPVAFRGVHATLELISIADVVECDESSGRTLWVVGQYQLVVRHDVVCLWLELQNGLAKSTRR